MDDTPNKVFYNYDKMVQLGLDVPISTRLSLALRNRGIVFDTMPIIPEEFIRCLSDYTGRNEK